MKTRAFGFVLFAYKWNMDFPLTLGISITIYVNFCEGGNGPEMPRKAMSWLTPWDNDSELR